MLSVAHNYRQSRYRNLRRQQPSAGAVSESADTADLSSDPSSGVGPLFTLELTHQLEPNNRALQVSLQVIKNTHF